ncbi:50S ribosomal protein L25 [Raphidocelis subcapitata]|uniref:50S ribosomal protein L25 n=1 Tax=Raphidocelis subcapitata TaxID=307507 RepID=A0A2V0P674_9CHLO|nr:50S ribosomal protein L25 [Raphidocelis subcapitata]|eukprot:GBF95346.1 50S ribosomal protein L25 [Raphidocelis subcapitata]
MLAALSQQLWPGAARALVQSAASSSAWQQAAWALGGSGSACSSACSSSSGSGAAACSSTRRAFSNAAASTSQQEQQQQHAAPPLEIPEHEMEDGLPVVTARLRALDGTNHCSKMRRRGRTPGLLFSLPGERHVLLDLETKEAAAHVRNFGRNGLLARVMRLELRDAEGQPLGALRVLPKAVHINSSTLAVENLRLMYLPRDRTALVPIPVSIWGEESAPGVRGGGWLHVVNRTVPFACPGWAVLPAIELDVRRMNANDVIRYSDVPPPPGCALRVKDASQPVVRCAVKVGGE